MAPIPPFPEEPSVPDGGDDGIIPLGSLPSGPAVSIPAVPVDIPTLSPPVARPAVTCWRCGHFVPPDPAGTCPSCSAKIAEPEPADGYGETGSPPARKVAERWEGSADSQSIKRLLWFYAILLGTTVLLGWITAAMIPDDVSELSKTLVGKCLATMAAFSVFDAILVIAALLSIRKVITLPSFERGGKGAFWWVMGIPALALLLGLNFGYHWVIFTAAGIKEEPDQILAFREFLPLILVLYCAMPAIFEEIFFRHVCLGVLRRQVDVHTAVFVSSMMFGLCHIGVLVSMPLLVVLGIGFGYVRVLSGSLLLPMILHFLHNLAIVLIEIYGS